MSYINLTKDNFEKEIKNYKGIAIVDFWASWCGPCLMLSPTIESLANDLGGKVKVTKLKLDDKDNSTENQKIAAEYGINGIPNISIFKNGEKIDEIVGAVPKEVILEKINSYL